LVVRKPLYGQSGASIEIPTSDTIRVAEPASVGQPLIFEQLAYNYFVGQYVSARNNCITNSTVALAANTLFAFPIFIARTVTFNQISSVVTTLVAGGQYRIGIYRDTGSLYPSTLVTGTDTGAYSSAALGNPLGTVTFSLTPGFYWIVIVSSSATAAFRGVPLAAFPNYLGETGSNFGVSSTANCFTGAFTFAVLPATFPVGATRNSSIAPLVGLRVASVP
jgi:hypothetical protein